MVQKALRELLQNAPHAKITVDQILKSVATIFQVRVTDLKGYSRAREIAVPRQVAMYLAKEMINESLNMLSASFGKDPLYPSSRLQERGEKNGSRRNFTTADIGMVRRNIAVANQ